MNIKENLLPDFATRTSSIDMLVFHCNAYDLETFSGYMKQYKTSAHYYIDEKGEITRLVAEENKAYHAGIGYWRGNTNINDRSIGIELQSKSLGQTPYPEAQIKSLIELSHELINKYKIVGQNIIGHSDSAPNIKPDPGLWFPWKYLAQNQIGLYPQSLSTPKETNIKKLINAIHEAGGIAVLAHPACCWAFNLDKFVGKLVSYGLDGIEVYYPYRRHRAVIRFATLRQIKDIAAKYDLIVTGGTDCHTRNITEY